MASSHTAADKIQQHAHSISCAPLLAVGCWLARAAVLLSLALSIQFVAPFPATRAAAESVDDSPYVRPVSTRLNVTGTDLTLPVPLHYDGESVGEVTVRIATDDAISFEKAALIDVLTPLLDAQANAALAALPDEAGLVSAEALTGAGLGARFDPALFRLDIAPPLDKRAVRKVSLRGSQRSVNTDLGTVAPARVSGFVNLRGGIDHDWAIGDRNGRTNVRLDVAPTLRASDVVLESAFSYDGTPGEVFCPITAICVGERNAGFKRQHTRLVYDWLGPHVRIAFGDAEPVTTTFQRSVDVLGVSIEHSLRKLEPGERTQPLGQSGLRLEEAAKVGVAVNGRVIRNLRLRPGVYDLADIPLQPGMNTIELRIEDENGAIRTQTFTRAHDGRLLAPGKSEWAAAAGTPSFISGGEREYHHGRWLGTAFLRSGILPELTAEVQGQADNDVAVAGGGLLAALPLGLLALNAAISSTESDIGYGINLSWTLSNANILLRRDVEQQGRETLGFGLEYRSADFRSPGALPQADDVLYPEWLYAWRFTGIYSAPITNTVTASLSARYQIAADIAAMSQKLAINEFTQDRYGVDLTVSAPLTDWSNGSLSLGYSNETATTRDDVDAEFRVMARVDLRPDRTTRVSSSYDSLDSATRLSGRKSSGKSIDRWDAGADLAMNGRQDRATSNASVGYTGNRLLARVSQAGAYDDFGLEGFAPQTQQQRTSAEVETAIAFADGHVALGAPIGNNGFAIVHPHESLAGKSVIVGEADDPQARTDALGAALVSNIPAYARRSLTIDAEDLPVGYSLGQSAFELKAPYRAGYALQVGSGYSVSAFGTLVDASGAPLALLAGSATPDGADGNATKKVEVFTNAEGRFAADGLAPGRWIIEMATPDAPVRFALTIPDGTDGLFKAGTLQPQ